MIESFIEGRVRLRFPLLADTVFAEHLRDALLEIDGVQTAEINPRTAGLLIEYDKGRLPLALLKETMLLLLRIKELENIPAARRIDALDEIMEDITEKLTGV